MVGVCGSKQEEKPEQFCFFCVKQGGTEFRNKEGFVHLLGIPMHNALLLRLWFLLAGRSRTGLRPAAAILVAGRSAYPAAYGPEVVPLYIDNPSNCTWLGRGNVEGGEAEKGMSVEARQRFLRPPACRLRSTAFVVCSAVSRTRGLWSVICGSSLSRPTGICHCRMSYCFAFFGASHVEPVQQVLLDKRTGGLITRWRR